MNIYQSTIIVLYSAAVVFPKATVSNISENVETDPDIIWEEDINTDLPSEGTTFGQTASTTTIDPSGTTGTPPTTTVYPTSSTEFYTTSTPTTEYYTTNSTPKVTVFPEPSPTTVPTTQSTTTRTPPGPADRICKGRDPYGREWQVPAGVNRTLPCLNNETGESWWQCNLDGNFDTPSPNFDNCRTRWFNAVEEIIKNATSFSGQSASVVCLEITRNLTNALEYYQLNAEGKGNGSIYGHEVISLMDSMQKLIAKTKLASINEGEDFTKSVVEVADITLQYSRPWEQLEQGQKSESVTKLLEYLELSGKLLANKMIADDSCSSCFKTLEFNTKIIESSTGFAENKEIIFPPQSDMIKGQDSFIQLPKVDGVVPFTAFRIKINALENLLPVTIRESAKENDLVLNSDLLTLSIHSENDVTGSVLLKDPVIITFLNDRESWGEKKLKINRRLHEGERPRAVKGSNKCAFWNTRLMVWSSEGCTLIASSQFSTTCSCTHLTSFTVISNVHEYVGKSTWLVVVTILALVILAGYSIWEIFFESKIPLKADATALDIAKKSSKTVRSLLKFALTASYGIIFFFVDRHFISLDDNWCYTVGLLTHFFILGLLIFMVFESIALIIAAKSIFKDEQKDTESTDRSENLSTNTNDENEIIEGSKQPEKLFLLALVKNYPTITRFLGAGIIALCIVSTTIIVDGVEGPNTRCYGGDFCWLDGDSIWAFYVPIIAVVFGSLFTCTTFYIQFSETVVLALTRQTAAMFSLIGVAWLIGFFKLGPFYVNSSFLSYAFVGLSAAQGFILNKFAGELEEKEKQGMLQKILKLKKSLLKSKQKNVPNSGSKDSNESLKKKCPTEIQNSIFNEEITDDTFTMRITEVAGESCTTCKCKRRNTEETQNGSDRRHRTFNKVRLSIEFSGNDLFDSVC